jgi:hypothetical protein
MDRLKPRPGFQTVSKITGSAFVPDVIFIAGNRMNGGDTTPDILGAIAPTLNFFSQTTIASLLRTFQGWIVIPVKQTEPPQ